MTISHAGEAARAALGTTYLLGDRNVFPVIIAHIAINLVIEPWLLLSSINKQGNTGKSSKAHPRGR